MFRPRDESARIGIDEVKIPCRNGTEFSEDGIVRFELPRNVGFAQLSNAYIELDIELTNPLNTPTQAAAQPALMLDRLCGASSLVNRLTIRSEGRLIEQLDGYNVMTNLVNNATDTRGSLNKRSRLEGCAASYQIVDSPFCSTNRCIRPIALPAVTPMVTGLTTAADCWKPLRRKVCLPINSGLFNSPHAFSLAMMPLEVEIILERALRAMRICNVGDGILDIQGKNLAGGTNPGDYQRRQIYVDARALYNGIGGNTPVPATAAAPSLAGEQNLNMLNNFPLRVGQVVYIDGTNVTPGEFTIEAIGVIANGEATNQGEVCIAFTTDVVNNTAASTDLVISQLAVGTNAPLAAHGAFGYRVFNPRMVVPKVVPPPETVQAMYQAMSRGAISQDIVTYTSYDNAIPASQTASTNIISAELTRCKSILSVPLTQSNLDNLNNSNAISGQYLRASQYEYQINNKLVPDRRVDLLREAAANNPLVAIGLDSVVRPYRLGTHPGGFHIFESEKALRSADIRVKNLNFITQNANVTTFDALEPGCWFVGRSLSANSGTSQNLVGKTAQLYLDYESTSNMVKLLRNFVVHIRTIEFGMSGIQIFY